MNIIGALLVAGQLVVVFSSQSINSIDNGGEEISDDEEPLLNDPLIKDSLEKADKQLYDLNPVKLRQMWHQAMVRSLLKSKAKVLCKSLPPIEKIVYRQCEADAKSLMQLARCLVRLMDERDRLEADIDMLERLRSEKRSRDTGFSTFADPTSPFYQLTPIIDLFTPKPMNQPTISLKKVYSTSALRERPIQRTRDRYMTHVDQVPYQNLETGRYGNRVNDNQLKFAVPAQQVDQSRLRTDAEWVKKPPRFNPIRSQLRTRYSMRERRRKEQEWRLVEADHFRRRVKRADYMSIEEAYEHFVKENKGSNGDVAFLGTFPINEERILPIGGSSGNKALVPRAESSYSNNNNRYNQYGTLPMTWNEAKKGVDPLRNVITEMKGKGAIAPVTFRPIKPKNETQSLSPVAQVFPQSNGQPQNAQQPQDVEQKGIKNMTLRILDLRMSKNESDNRILSLPSRNLIGLPRYLSREKTMRTKRSIPDAAPIQNQAIQLPQPGNGYSPNIDFASIARKYLGHFLGKPMTNRVSSEHPLTALSNTDKLQLIKDHFGRVDKCNQYFKLMSEENKSVFKQLGVPIDIRSPKVAASDEEEILHGVVDMLNDFAVDQNGGKKRTKWSVLSPRFFSLFPNGKKNDRIISKGQVLSPSLLSFHKDGLFSIPDIFNMLTSDRSSQSAMLEMLMDLSGASTVLDDAIIKLEKEIEHTKNVQYPLVQEMSRHDYAWLQAQKTYTPEQRRQIDERGYTFLEPHQLKHVYGENVNNLKVDLDEYGRMSEREREARIEKDIRNLADIGETRRKQSERWGRKKRQTDEKWYERDNTVTVDEKIPENNPALDSPALDGLQSSTATSTTVHDGAGVPSAPDVQHQAANLTDNSSVMHGSGGVVQNVHWLLNNGSGPGSDADLLDGLGEPVNSTHVYPTTNMTDTVAGSHGHGGSGSVSGHGTVHGTTAKPKHGHDNAVGGEDLGPEGDIEHRINGVEFTTLEPFAFTNIVNHGAALEVVTLSPHAFVGEIITPEALILSTLSPRAFVATVLSPAALVARILSPTAFRAEVLAPRALYTWILSPEAMIAEVLTPHILEPRVLSPEMFIINVLSPRILAPNILSPEAFGVMVLSPNILSPRIASDEKYLVEVLSPHVLGGPHSKEEEEETVISIGGGHKEHEGETHGGENHPAHGPEAALDLNGGGTSHGAAHDGDEHGGHL